MKFNFKVRAKNPYFWFGVIGVIITAMGADVSMFTSWVAVWDAIVDLFTNPFMLGCVAVAVTGIFIDPTTKGICDSSLAMTYDKPKVDE
jgi:phi LC3 family holin